MKKQKLYMFESNTRVGLTGLTDTFLQNVVASADKIVSITTQMVVVDPAGPTFIWIASIVVTEN